MSAQRMRSLAPRTYRQLPLLQMGGFQEVLYRPLRPQRRTINRKTDPKKDSGTEFSTVNATNPEGALKICRIIMRCAQQVERKMA